jgi:hypothetical protein
MPSKRREHPVKEAARGIALLTGLAIGTVAAATVIAATVLHLAG